MKKNVLILAAMASLGMTLNAQTLVTSMERSLGGYIHKDFTSDHNAMLIFGFGDEDDNTFLIYNSSLQLAKTLTLDLGTYTNYGTEERYHNRVLQYTWGDTTERQQNICYSNYLDFDNNSDMPSSVFTQTLFNNDSKFEYVVPRYNGAYTYEYTKRENVWIDGYWDDVQNEWIDGYYDSVDVTHRYTRTKVEALDVKNEDGTVVNSISLPADALSFDDDLAVIKLGGVYYLIVEAWQANSHKMYFYRLDHQSSSIQQVAEIPINVFPSVADRSQTITVELGEGTNASEVQVINTLGQVVKTVPVQAGQRKVQLRASDLNSGMHIVGTRSHEGKGACKIIVK